MNNSAEKAFWLKDDIWYSPASVICHYGSHLDALPPEEKTTKAFRKADELLVSAIALLGIQEDESEKYWMQAVSDDEGTPDVRTGRWLPQIGSGARHWEYQDIEFVSFVPADGEDIPTFLHRTKLSRKKAYDDKTIILCHITRPIHVPSWPAITEALRNIPRKSPIIVIGRTHPERKDYVLIQIHPQFKRIAAYNLDEILKKEDRRGVLRLHRGSKPMNESRPNEEHCPFETSGFECPLIKGQKHPSHPRPEN
jgi:hypothetical protein